MSSFKRQGRDNDDSPNKNRLKRQYMRSLTEEPSADIIVEGYLCVDVLTNILVRLPAKQLARLRCVSKQLNDLLSQPFFINSHLQHHRFLNQNISDEILLVFFEDRFTVHPSSSPNIQLPNFVKLPANFPSKYSLIGSVNGLICFSSGSSYNSVIYIWNPSLSALMALQQYPTRTSRVNFRFGFDPKTNDYKVVLYTLEFRLPNIIEPSIFPNCLQVEVYSLRKGSWELVTQRFPLHVTVNNAEDQDCIDGENGHIHWLCDYDNMSFQTIVEFDLGLQTFSEISLLNSIMEFKYQWNVLRVLAGKLCAMSSNIITNECEVWVMDEYDVTESWVKKHVFSMSSGPICPHGFTLHKELLFEIRRPMALYDPVSDTVKSFAEDLSLPNNHIYRVKYVSYVESLVWVAPTS